MRLKLPLGVNFNVHVLCKWHGRYRSQNTSWNMYTCMDEICIRGHHVSKDFCTPIINEVCNGSQEGNFWGRPHPRKKSVIARCYYKLELSQLLYGTAVIISTTYSRVDLKIVSYTFSYMAVPLAEVCAVITNSTLIQGNFWYIISL